MHLDLSFLGLGETAQLAGYYLAIRLGSLAFERFWKKNRPGTEEGLNSADEWVETKTGLKFSPEVHAAWGEMVKRIVSGIDYVANPVIFRRCERFIIGLADPSRRAILLSELYAYASGKAKETINKELQGIINDASKEEAITQVKAEASLTLPPAFVAKQDIPAAIEAAVVVLKSEKPEVQPETVLKKIEVMPIRTQETQALVEKLREKVNAGKKLDAVIDIVKNQ